MCCPPGTVEQGHRAHCGTERHCHRSRHSQHCGPTRRSDGTTTARHMDRPAAQKQGSTEAGHGQPQQAKPSQPQQACQANHSRHSSRAHRMYLTRSRAQAKPPSTCTRGAQPGPSRAGSQRGCAAQQLATSLGQPRGAATPKVALGSAASSGAAANSSSGIPLQHSNVPQAVRLLPPQISQPQGGYKRHWCPTCSKWSWPLGGSPRSARMLRMPYSLACAGGRNLAGLVGSFG